VSHSRSSSEEPIICGICYEHEAYEQEMHEKADHTYVCVCCGEEFFSLMDYPLCPHLCESGLCLGAHLRPDGNSHTLLAKITWRVHSWGAFWTPQGVHILWHRWHRERHIRRQLQEDDLPF